MNRLEFKNNIPEIGLMTRTPTPGPELEMVKKAIPDIINSFERRGYEIAIFFEPKIEIGFPDVVVAVYSYEKYQNWPSSRYLINTTDLKIVHHLYNYKGMSSIDLEKKLGFKSREILRSIERLIDSGFIRRVKSKWYLVPLNKILGIRRLIAIEAKVKNWSNAFEQAETNFWFASDSYILSPISRPLSNTLYHSSNFNVGILAFGNGSTKEIVPAVKSKFPSSYVSWLFNEWIGREINRKN